MKIPRTCIPCEKIENDGYDWYARHEAKLQEVKSKRADIVFIGDSITHFWNKEENIGYGADVWEEFYGKRHVLNLGYGFDRTQNMLWRLEHGEMEGQDPDIIVVNAGTNQFSYTPNYDGDSPEEAFEGVKKLLETLRGLAPRAKILLMAVFPRMPEEKQQKIDSLNQLLKKYVSSSEDLKLSFIDITEKFRYPDGSFNSELYTDRCCHPNSAGYRIWANAIEPEIIAALQHTVTNQ